MRHSALSLTGRKIRSFSCPGNGLLWISCPEVISLGIPVGKAAHRSSPTRLSRCMQNRQSCHLLMISCKKGSESLTMAIFHFEVQFNCLVFLESNNPKFTATKFKIIKKWRPLQVCPRRNQGLVNQTVIRLLFNSGN